LFPEPLPKFLKVELKRQEMILVCWVVLGALVDPVARLSQGLLVFLVFPLSLEIQENLLALLALDGINNISVSIMKTLIRL